MFCKLVALQLFAQMASPEASSAADEDLIPRLAAITTAAAANGGRKFGVAVSEPRARESQTDPCVGVIHLFDILDGDHLPVVESILLRYGPSAVLLPKDFPSSKFMTDSAHTVQHNGFNVYGFLFEGLKMPLACCYPSYCLIC